MAKRNHIPALDGLRGIAVLAVMLYHLGGGAQSHNTLVHLAGLATRYGFIGVQLFFVLSGFLITGILWDSKGSPSWWRNFFIRRALRIFPLYYASLLLNLIVSLLMGFGWKAFSLWTFALYLQNFPSVGHPLEQAYNLALPLAHYWSLAVEEQFYLIWPLVLLRTRTLGQAIASCVVVVMLSVSVNLYLGFHQMPWDTVLFFSNMGALGAGGLLALGYRTPAWPRFLAWSPAVALAGLCGFLVVDHFNDYRQPMFHLPMLWLLFAGMLMMCLRPGILTGLMSMSWLRWVGRISYGLYVFPALLLPFTWWIVNRIAGSSSREAHLALVFLVGMGVSFAAAALSFTFFENPILSLKKRFPAAEAVPAAVTVREPVAG